MKWKNDKPTVEGWYWYRQPRKNGIREGQFYPSTMAHVDGSLWCDCDSQYDAVTAFDGQWAGPIPEPNE